MEMLMLVVIRMLVLAKDWFLGTSFGNSRTGYLSYNQVILFHFLATFYLLPHYCVTCIMAYFIKEQLLCVSLSLINLNHSQILELANG